MSSANHARMQQAWLSAKETTQKATTTLQQALDDLVEAQLDEERKRLEMLGASSPSSEA